MAPDGDAESVAFASFVSELDRIIDTPTQASFWLHFWEAARRAMLIPPSGWPAEDVLRRELFGCHSRREREELEFLLLLHEVAHDPPVAARLVCAIDVWAARTRLEWGLG